MASIRDRLHTIGRRAIALVLLMIVLLHAAAPTAFAFERKTGSAFGAATDDVSLRAPAPADEADETPLLEPPRLPLESVPLPHPRPVIAAGPELPDTTGPPTAAATLSPLLRTGPPAA